jgi:hypothetical protein
MDFSLVIILYLSNGCKTFRITRMNLMRKELFNCFIIIHWHELLNCNF